MTKQSKIHLALAWFQILLCLVIERFQALRDPKIRFQQAQSGILKHYYREAA